MVIHNVNLHVATMVIAGACFIMVPGDSKWLPVVDHGYQEPFMQRRLPHSVTYGILALRLELLIKLLNAKYLNQPQHIGSKTLR